MPTISNTRGHGDERDTIQAAKHGRKRRLHARDGDYDIRGADSIPLPKQSVEPGHAHINDHIRPGAAYRHGGRTFMNDRQVGCACPDDGDLSGVKDLFTENREPAYLVNLGGG